MKPRAIPLDLVRLFLLSACLLLGACKENMDNEPKFLPDQQNHYFPSMNPDRPPPAHTVPSGHLDNNPAFVSGQADGRLIETFPLHIDEQLLARGGEAFEIHCSACHGRDGYGNGIVVQRGFPSPPSFHSERLRVAPIGHFFEVITDGYGAMYPFASRVTPTERWAIIAYIRALQFSQHAPVSQLPVEDKEKLSTTP